MNIVGFNELISLHESHSLKTDDTKVKKIVCVHWLKQQCKRGKECPYLHRYLEDKVPVCRYFSTEGFCLKG